MLTNRHRSAKRYERLLKSHDITVATPRKGAASGKDKGDDDNDSESKDVKTPATKKRKRGAASEIIKDDDDEEETPVKKERAGMKREKGVKKEETIEVKVKKEAAAANGSLQHDARDAIQHCDLHAIPEAYPRPSRSDLPVDVPAGDGDEDYCVVVGERPASAPAAYLFPTSGGHGHGREAPSALDCRHHHTAFHCQGANLGFAQQSSTTSTSNSSEPSNNGVFAMPLPHSSPSFGFGNWNMNHHRSP